MFKEPRNRFQEIDSASLCPGGPVQQPYFSSVPSPLIVLKLLKRLQIRAQATLDSGICSLESIPGLLKRLQIRAQATLASGIGSLESIPELLKR
jgi:hypothetical protein